MAEHSFDIKSSKDFFNKLLAEYEDYRKDLTSSRLALNCALTAWHLVDWVNSEFDENKQVFMNNCPALRIMRDLSNGTKHCKITRYHPEIKETNLHQGAFSNDFSRDFDISTLDIEMENGERKFFEDEIDIVISFWKNYFKNEEC